MGEVTGISWTDKTYNPWRGCQKVSPACDNCYAEKWVTGRMGEDVWGPGKPRKRAAPATLNSPLKWEREAAAAGERPFVFTASLADIMDNAVPIEWLADAVKMARATPHLVHLWLTKRPQNILRRIEAVGDFAPNIALGTTVEDAKRRQNLTWLCQAGASLRPLFLFGSFEPLLEGVDISAWLRPHCGVGLDWVICGGESGALARPMHPDWARSLRDQAARAGAAFHFKQWGEWAPLSQVQDRAAAHRSAGRFDRATGCTRVGKKNSGRLLDGVLHNARPTVPPLLLEAA